MPALINTGAIRRATRVEILKALIVILVISLVLMVIFSLIFKSFHTCQGAFGDTVHLDLRKHQNYEKLFHGKCSENYHRKVHEDDANDHKFPFIARFVYTNDTQKVIFCSGSLISGEF